MKKLKLKAFELGTTDILTRQQLRNVLGGTVATSTTTTTQVHTIGKCGGQCLSGDIIPATASCVVNQFSNLCGCPPIGIVWTTSNCAYHS